MIDIFKLTKLDDKIYILTFDNDYVLAMHFLRYQEFYESHNLNFKNHAFTIIDYMNWYTTQFKKTLEFSYPADWAGFNFPGKIIQRVREKGIPDYNKYDAFMTSVNDIIIAGGDDDYYLIGARKDSVDTIQHEIAHAKYYLDPDYRISVNELIKKIPQEIVGKVFDIMREYGYCNDVLNDEFQAYMATGALNEEMEKLTKPYEQKFIDLFKKEKIKND